MKLFLTKFSNEHSLKALDLIKEGDIGFGKLSTEFENQFKIQSKKKYNISTNSASASAFMIFDYLKDVYGECNVYTPSLAFTSPVWAAKHHGHNIIFTDVNSDLVFDSSDYLSKRASSDKRKTIVMPILYGGISNIPQLKLKGDEIVVVDSAHCVSPKIKSDFTFFSFHPYKPICSSDGGMISTDDKKASDFFRQYRNFGRKNIENSYDIVQSGFKFYMNNLNACLALESLKTHKERLKERKDNFNSLKSRIGIFGDILFNAKLLSHDKDSSYYFATVIADNNNRDKLKKIYPTSTHYPLLHKTKYFKSEVKLNNSESIYDNIINIPLYSDNQSSISDIWADSIILN
jgi:dTDP-4-amino-4,6-dideoxygalactose transaminase